MHRYLSLGRHCIPRPGYPACPDHQAKPPLFELLNAEATTGIKLTDGTLQCEDGASAGCAPKG